MTNASVAQRRTDAISRGVGVQTEIYVDRALNAEVWDIDIPAPGPTFDSLSQIAAVASGR